MLSAKCHAFCLKYSLTQFDGILPKGSYPPCLRMADRAPFARYPRIQSDKSHKCEYTISESDFGSLLQGNKIAIDVACKILKSCTDALIWFMWFQCTLAGAPFTNMTAWISNHIHYKMWDEMTYPFPKFNGATVEVWEWISNFTHTLVACDYLSMLRLKLNHVSKRGLGNVVALLHYPLRTNGVSRHVNLHITLPGL